MQNEVFNRRLFQRKDGARTRLNQLARADQPSGILASSQPLIDEAMKSVRRPETSAIPMDVAKGMSAGRAGGMPMAPAPMPMPYGATSCTNAHGPSSTTDGPSTTAAA